MTKITVFQDKNHGFLGFDCTGHAGFADKGQDIVCAGISILVQNTVNAIEKFTDEGFSCEADTVTGNIHFRFKQPAEHDAELLLKAMIEGLEGIQSSYGKRFLKLQFREV